MLSEQDFQRYKRQVTLKGFGKEGQTRLKKARVLIVGMGGLGTPVALYLAAMGVGHLGLMDPDRVDLSNLHRQILYREQDVGFFKVEAAAEALKLRNSLIRIQTHVKAINTENLDVINQYDLVVEGSDLLSVRYLLNKACRTRGKPYLFAGIQAWQGLLALFQPDRGPCYQCLFPKAPPPGSLPSCGEGVLAVLPGTLGLLQAGWAVRHLTGIGEPLEGQVLSYDFLSARQSVISLCSSPDCPICQGCTEEELLSIEEVGAERLSNWMRHKEEFLLIDVRETWEHALGSIPGSLNIPLRKLNPELNRLAKDVKVVVYCESGQRSWEGARLLAQSGFRRAYSLQGGVRAWFYSPIKPAIKSDPFC